MTAPKPTLDGVARAYIRLAVGLGEHDGDSIDYYDGPPEWVADIRKNAQPLTEIRSSSVELVEELQGMVLSDATSETRRSFLIGQLEAVACHASELAGARMTFDQEAMCAFGHTAPKELDEKDLKATRAKISALVGGQGNLTKRYNDFEGKYVVPPARLKAVMVRAIAGCRAATAGHMTLPSDESIQLEFVGHEPWAGYSLYKGGHKSLVSINTDFPVTVDRALDLACHEAYPGHHTYNMTQDDVLAKHGAIETMVQPTYSPQSFLSESAATIAVEMAFPPAARAKFEREELFPLAGLPVPSETEMARYIEIEGLMERLQPAIATIARRYVDGELEFVRAETALEDEALIGNSFESLKYLNEFRSYIVTYTCGPDILNGFLPKPGTTDAEDRRWKTYLHWMRTESTPSSTVH